MKTELVVFLIAVAVAVAQVILLSRLFVSLKEGKRGKTFLIIMFKIASYIALCYFVIFKYGAQLMFAFSGFLAGLPIAAIILFFVYHYKDEIKNLIGKIKKP